VSTDILYILFNRLPLPVYPYRMYMHKYKCIHIHIPKNAGTSVLRALGHQRGRDHVEWRHYAGANPRWFANYHKFAICRHPIDRLLSAYNYALRGGNHSETDRRLQQQVQKSKDFNAFCESQLSPMFTRLNVLFAPQYAFVARDEKNLVIDSLLRFEQLDSDWRALATRFGINSELPAANQGCGASSEIWLTLSDRAKDTIRHVYSLDFALFGYELEPDNARCT
jgi:hypothetical protein